MPNQADTETPAESEAEAADTLIPGQNEAEPEPEKTDLYRRRSSNPPAMQALSSSRKQARCSSFISQVPEAMTQPKMASAICS